MGAFRVDGVLGACYNFYIDGGMRFPSMREWRYRI